MQVPFDADAPVSFPPTKQFGEMMKIQVGKSTIEVTVEGCIQCGTRWSSGWTVAKILTVKIGKREQAISLFICADCQKATEGRQALLL